MVPFRFIAAAALTFFSLSGEAHATLIGLYTFDDPQQLGKDSSGRGNDLVVVGSVAAGAGTSGGGLALSGNGYLTTASGAVPAGFPVGASSYTIEADFRSAIGNYSGAMIGWGNYGTQDGVNVLRTSNETGDAGHWGIHNYWWADDANAEPLTVGDLGWHRAIATYSAVTGIRDLYLDNVRVSSDRPTGTPNVGSGSFTLGSGNNATQDLNGGLDNVAIYDVPLTDVPEPGTMMLLGLGFGGTCLLRCWSAGLF